MIGFVILAYIRSASWAFLLAFLAPIAVAMAVTRQSLPTYLINGAAVVFAGVVAAGRANYRRRCGGGWRPAWPRACSAPSCYFEAPAMRLMGRGFWRRYW